jgi:hypothetical protein
VKYVLILFFAFGSQPATTTAVFDDRPACEAAISQFQLTAQAQHWDLLGRMLFVCVPQATELPT